MNGFKLWIISKTRTALFLPLWLSIVFAFCAASAWGQEPKVLLLTLEECQRLALEKNKDIQKAREYRNSVMGRYLEERSAALPQFPSTPISITGGTNRRGVCTAAFSLLSRKSAPPRSGFLSPSTRLDESGRPSGRPKSAWRPRKISCASISRRRFGM